jgi:hypothetical protein
VEERGARLGHGRLAFAQPFLADFEALIACCRDLQRAVDGQRYGLLRRPARRSFSGGG